MKPVIFIVLVVTHSLSAQQGDYSLGARSGSMGRTGTALPDSFSAFNNIGSAAIPGNSTIAFSIRNLYSMEGLYAMGAAWNQKIRRASLVFSIYRFGNRLFSEHKIGIGYSHRIRFISLGIQVDYFQQSVGNLGTSGTVMLEAGGVVTLFKELTFGAFILNPAHATVGVREKHPLPVMLKAGVVFTPDDLTTLSLDVHRLYTGDRSSLNRVSLGLEYVLREIVPLRAGMIFNPPVITAGSGVRMNRLNLDLCMELNPNLGISSQLSVIYKFLKR